MHMTNAAMRRANRQKLRHDLLNPQRETDRQSGGLHTATNGELKWSPMGRALQLLMDGVVDIRRDQPDPYGNPLTQWVAAEHESAEPASDVMSPCMNLPAGQDWVDVVVSVYGLSRRSVARIEAAAASDVKYALIAETLATVPDQAPCVPLPARHLLLAGESAPAALDDIAQVDLIRQAGLRRKICDFPSPWTLRDEGGPSLGKRALLIWYRPTLAAPGDATTRNYQQLRYVRQSGAWEAIPGYLDVGDPWPQALLRAVVCRWLDHTLQEAQSMVGLDIPPDPVAEPAWEGYVERLMHRLTSDASGALSYHDKQVVIAGARAALAHNTSRSDAPVTPRELMWRASDGYVWAGHDTKEVRNWTHITMATAVEEYRQTLQRLRDIYPETPHERATLGG